jgi:hypothetical protein
LKKEPDQLPTRRVDELARRRSVRQSTDPLRSEGEGQQEQEEIKFSWSDTFAMIIAAYQVLLPMLLLMVGTLVLIYLLFFWFFR